MYIGYINTFLTWHIHIHPHTDIQIQWNHTLTKDMKTYTIQQTPFPHLAPKNTLEWRLSSSLHTLTGLFHQFVQFLPISTRTREDATPRELGRGIILSLPKINVHYYFGGNIFISWIKWGEVCGNFTDTLFLYTFLAYSASRLAIWSLLFGPNLLVPQASVLGWCHSCLAHAAPRGPLDPFY